MHSMIGEGINCAKRPEGLDPRWGVEGLQHNAHFRDNRCRFQHPMTPFSTPLTPRRPRNRKPQVLGSCSRMPRNLPSPLTYPLFHHFCRPKISQAQKWPPTTYALGLPNIAACAALLHGPLQLQIWNPFPFSAFLFPTIARQSAIYLLTQPSFHFLSPLKDHLPPSRFWYHFQIVSRLYIAVLTLLPFVLTSAAVAITP
jgi:hypothetical protein